MRFWTATLAGGVVLIGTALGVRRLVEDRESRRVEEELLASPSHEQAVFVPDLVADLPDPVRRYLLHAIAPGTPLSSVVYLRMDGTMTPNPGSPQVDLEAEETLAPRRGFVWTARARMFGLPIRVRDHYFESEGGVGVDLLGLIPIPFPGQREDVTRSSRGRLIAEAVWCPTALVGSGVTWEAVDADRARFRLEVDGEAITVTIRVGPDGALRDVTLDRWGEVRQDGGEPGWDWLPYGFEVMEEATFEGVTIPTRLRGGWGYGTDNFNPHEAATFTIRSAEYQRMPPV